MRFYTGLESEWEDEINMITDGTAVYNLYLVCISQRDNNLLHILSSYEALKTVNAACGYTVIALAEGRENAFEKAKDILWQWYSARGNFMGFRNFYTKGI